MKFTEHIKAHQNLYIVGFIGLAIGLILGISSSRDGYYSRYDMDDMRQKTHRMQDGRMMNGTEHGSAMEDMMMDMNAALEGKVGAEFDQAFLSEMIVHHEGAVSMARKVLATSKRPELIKLANEIIAAQTREINMMNNWLNVWFTTPSSTVTPTNPTAPTTGGSMPSQPVACTMEAKVCSDGSYVGRSGPNCEFAPCPGN